MDNGNDCKFSSRRWKGREENWSEKIMRIYVGQRMRVCKGQFMYRTNMHSSVDT
jgi:hypothetical protein